LSILNSVSNRPQKISIDPLNNVLKFIFETVAQLSFIKLFLLKTGNIKNVTPKTRLSKFYKTKESKSLRKKASNYKCIVIILKNQNRENS